MLLVCICSCIHVNITNVCIYLHDVVSRSRLSIRITAGGRLRVVKAKADIFPLVVFIIGLLS